MVGEGEGIKAGGAAVELVDCDDSLSASFFESGFFGAAADGIVSLTFLPLFLDVSLTVSLSPETAGARAALDSFLSFF